MGYSDNVIDDTPQDHAFGDSEQSSDEEDMMADVIAAKAQLEEKERLQNNTPVNNDAPLFEEDDGDILGLFK